MKASPTLTTNMQAVLVDLIELHVQGKQAHWNIVGTNFRDLHLQLDEIIEAAREFADDMAERMRALHALPDGRSATVSKSTSLAQFPAGLINTKDAVERIVLHKGVTGLTLDHHGIVAIGFIAVDQPVVIALDFILFDFVGRERNIIQNIRVEERGARQDDCDCCHETESRGVYAV